MMKRVFVLTLIFFSFFVRSEDIWQTSFYKSWAGGAGFCFWWDVTGDGTFMTVVYSLGWARAMTFMYSDGSAEILPNGYAGKLNGTMSCYDAAEEGKQAYISILKCPDTRFCQKSACGFECGVHGQSTSCSTVTCSKCGGSYCSEHMVHMCFSVTCPEGTTHNFAGNATKNVASYVASVQAAYDAAYPQISTCSSCGGGKCSLCAHTCKHTSECVLNNCTVCGVQWCNIHGVVPIYITCETCGRMTCNHQTHTCDPNDPNNPNVNPNQTNSQTANNTTQIANNTTQVVNNTNTIVNNTNQIVNNTTTIANNTTQIVNNTNQIVNNTTTIANNTTQIANNTQNIANNTENIANNTANIANNTSNTANNTANIANNTSQMASTLNTVAAGVTNSAAAAQAAADKIPDMEENVPTAEAPMEVLPDRSGAFTTITEKLLPDFSFFTISGSEFPSWTFNFPLSSFGVGLSDMSFVVGGEAWGTVAEGKLLWLMTLIRGMSYLCFSYIFLMAVIRALRQW